jgi:hypothetical protein
LSLSTELGQKLITAGSDYMKVKTIATTLFSSHQYDDLKVKGVMDDLTKALEVFKQLVAELQTL